MVLPRIAIVCLLACVGGCSPPPGLESGARIMPSDEPVALLPLEGLVSQSESGAFNDASADELAARAARLRARAAVN